MEESTETQNCLFCGLGSGSLPSKKVYEDDLCFAIVDINPATKGHMLLMPKEHHTILPQTPEETVKRLGKVARMLSKSAIRGLGAEGTNIFIANGAVAGQRAPHLIVHIIPRKEGDGITAFDLPEKAIPEQITMQLQQALTKKSGMKIEPVRNFHPEVTETISARKYITSENAKRFHISTCPFADKISREKRIYLTEAEMRKSGRVSCECTGLGKKKLEEIDLDQLEKLVE